MTVKLQKPAPHVCGFPRQFATVVFGWKTCYSLKCESSWHGLDLKPQCQSLSTLLKEQLFGHNAAGWSIRLSQSAYKIGCGGPQCTEPASLILPFRFELIHVPA